MELLSIHISLLEGLKSRCRCGCLICGRGWPGTASSLLCWGNTKVCRSFREVWSHQGSPENPACISQYRCLQKFRTNRRSWLPVITHRMTQKVWPEVSDLRDCHLKYKPRPHSFSKTASGSRNPTVGKHRISPFFLFKIIAWILEQMTPMWFLLSKMPTE